MSKVLTASCDAQGVVKYEGVEVPDCEVMSEGKQASEGILIISGGVVKYLPSSALDIKSTLDKISLSLVEIVAALTAIDAKPVGGTGSAAVPAVVGNVASLNSLKAEIDTLKGALK